jgi:hypothetical protein
LSTPRFGAVIGLALGAIWAIAGFPGAVLAGLLSAAGSLTALVLQGRVDLTGLVEAFRDRRPDEPTGSEPTTKRTRTTLK